MCIDQINLIKASVQDERLTIVAKAEEQENEFGVLAIDVEKVE